MKNHIIKLLLFLTVGVSQQDWNIKFMEEYGGLTYSPNSNKPYTGKVFDLYKSNGNKKVEGYYKDGNQDRKWTYWYENGQKSSAGPYKDGKEDGLWTYYTEVGNGKYEVTFKAGIYTTAVFTDSLGIDYTGSPITDEPEQDGIFLYQDDEGGEYDLTYFPLVFATLKNGE